MTRREEIYAGSVDRVHRETDRMFFWLLIAQWVFAISLALAISPLTWNGAEFELHFHVKVALVFGAAINILPLVLIKLRPGWWGTRHTVAVVQMMWSAILIMITGGRIETHFHVFGSLAFLAFYRDWKLLPTATVVVAIDHLARGLLAPESVYGIANPEWWRFLEHAGWVTFENTILVLGCQRALAEMRIMADREAALEQTNDEIEKQVTDRTGELAENVERYRALVETTNAIPWEVDTKTGRTLYIAPQAAEMFELGFHELYDAEKWNAMIPPDERERLFKTLRDFGAGVGDRDHVDWRVVTKSGRTVHARTMLSARSRGGRIVRGITLDITKQRTLEAELRQAQKLESVGRLAAGVAHEINTPIQYVSDMVTFVREAMTDLVDVADRHRAISRAVIEGGHPDAAARHALESEGDADLPYILDHMPKALDTAIDGLGRVATIVRSMKAFAHPSSDMIAVDLNHAIQSTLTIARNEYKYVADLVTELGDLPQVACHVGEINQVVLNIVVNAAHAIRDVVAPTNGRGTIRVATRRHGDGEVEIAISDTGTGIPEAIRDRVFDPFFTTKDVGSGTGQGLAMARSVVVDKHHGSLTFDTAPGVGTTFTIRIPITMHARARAA